MDGGQHIVHVTMWAGAGNPAAVLVTEISQKNTVDPEPRAAANPRPRGYKEAHGVLRGFSQER